VRGSFAASPRQRRFFHASTTSRVQNTTTKEKGTGPDKIVLEESKLWEVVLAQDEEGEGASLDAQVYRLTAQ
jgi:hypothetical protein